MEYLLGAVAALLVCVSATFIGFDRDRSFYPVVMIVIAFYYALFALIDGSPSVLVAESLAISAFVLASIAGFKLNLWLVVLALAAHGIFDFVHGHFITNTGVPGWWPGMCLSYDIAAAAYLAWLLGTSKLPVRPLTRRTS